MPGSHTIPGALLIVCKVAPDSKIKAPLDLRPPSPAFIESHNPIRPSISAFAATLAAVPGSATIQDPKINISSLPTSVGRDGLQRAIYVPDGGLDISSPLHSVATSIRSIPLSDLAKQFELVQSKAPINLKKTTVKYNKNRLFITNVESELSSPAEPIISFIPLLESKEDIAPLLKGSLNGISFNSTTPKIENITVTTKHFQLATPSKFELNPIILNENATQISTMNVAKSVQESISITQHEILPAESTVFSHSVSILGNTEMPSLAMSKQIDVGSLTSPARLSPTEQIAPVLMRINSVDGSRQISLQLTPDTLGRVDILIDQNTDGPTVVTITVNHQHTMDLLKADQTQLSQALDRSGLPAAQRVIIFHLDESSLHVGITVVSVQQSSHTTTTTSILDGKLQFDQGTNSENQRRPSTGRTPYPLSPSENFDANWKNSSGETGDTDTSLYFINITA